jgi:hypothetical protein
MEAARPGYSLTQYCIAAEADGFAQPPPARPRQAGAVRSQQHHHRALERSYQSPACVALFGAVRRAAPTHAPDIPKT